jgi:hypothetical protein
MTDAFFIIIYGLLLISGCFMFPVWLRIMRKAQAQGDSDYATVAAALALNSAGTIVVFGPRLVYGFSSGRWSSIDGFLGWAVLIGLMLLESSKVTLMYVRRGHGSLKAWWAYAIVSIVWTLCAALWVLA